jgi:putative DNA primase/helicase
MDNRKRAWSKKHSGRSHDQTFTEVMRQLFGGSVGGYDEIESEDNTEITKPKYFTDVTNAKVFVEFHGHEIRYCFVSKKWLVWDGTRWVFDDNGEIQRRAKDTTQRMWKMVDTIDDEDTRSKFAKHVLRTQSESRIKAMINLAQSESEIPVRLDELDCDPWLLNTQNGTLDLKTGKLRPHNRKDLITKITPVVYNPAATCPTWDAFLKQITDGNEDLIKFLQKAIGYSLTGSTEEQAMFILYGTGANGKSTFINQVMSLLGDYAQQTPTETLLRKHGTGIPNDIARLKGARFVAAVESESGKQLAEVLVKQLTGGDKIAARRLYEDFFEFVPICKFFVAVNDRPIIKGTDHGIWRRIRLVPFSITIPAAERDKKLGQKLKLELPGVLRWAVEGCLLWQREGLGTPEAVTEATDAYQSEMNILGRFIAERCEIDPEAKTPISQLYGAYIHWCSDNSLINLNHIEFSQQLENQGFAPQRNKKLRFRSGIKLRGDNGDTR